MNKKQLALSVLLAWPVVHACQAQETPVRTEQQEKFALLSLISMASSGVGLYQTLSNWAGAHFAQAPAAAPTPAAAAVPFAPPSAAGVAMPYTQAPSYSPALLIMGAPDVGLAGQGASFDPSRGWDSRSNYQGVAVSALILDAQLRVIETRSLSSPFRSGERFKLRVVSTGDALVSLDALHAPPGSIAANGVLTGAPSYMGQMYPAKADQVVQVKGGEVTQLPLGSTEYFTFDDQAGTDLLALNVRHPLARPASINRQPLYRQDGPTTSTYSQLVQGGSYLALTQLIPLQRKN